MAKRTGIFTIVFLCLLTSVLFVLSKTSFKILLDSPLLALSQYLSLIGTTLLCISFILSTRLHRLEEMFGGLDKVYGVHSVVGALNFVFLLNHPILLILNSLSNKIPALVYALPGNKLEYNFGIFALYLLILLLAFTIFIKLPYHIWKLTHQLMGAVLVLAFFHITSISSDVSRYQPLRLWMLFLLSAGLVAYIYKLIFYAKSQMHPYVVTKINRLGDITEVYLEHKKKPLRFKPGQFVFIRFKGQNVPTEEHPFSISSVPTDKYLRLSIKSLGDFTSTLDRLQENDPVEVFGPYGKFLADFEQTKDVIFVAGGIGITPFLSMFGSVKETDERTVYLFYTNKSGGTSYGNAELTKLISGRKNLKYCPWDSSKFGKLTALRISEMVGSSKDKLVFLCGPEAMMYDLTNQFVKLGVKRSSIYFENFSLR